MLKESEADKVLSLLQRNGGKLSRRELQQKAHLKTAEIKTVLESLESSKEISIEGKTISLKESPDGATGTATESIGLADIATGGVEQAKPETKPVTIRTKFSGPRPKFGSGVPSTDPCSVEFPSKILEAAGMSANNQVEVTASENLITITKIADGTPLFPNRDPKPGGLIDQLMAITRQREAAHRARGCG
jgi:hypothetical protein